MCRPRAHPKRTLWAALLALFIFAQPSSAPDLNISKLPQIYGMATSVNPDSEPWYVVQLGDKDKSSAWTDDISPHIGADVVDTLVNYSHIPQDQVESHIYATRDKLWQQRAHPCTGTGTFLIPAIATSPHYHTILATVKSGASLIDVGCFIGHDLRKLVKDGCSDSSNMVGLDVFDFWGTGFEFFQDSAKFKGQFVSGDILDQSTLKSLEHRFEIVFTSKVLHQWTRKKQLVAAVNLVSLSKGPGSFIIGDHGGSSESSFELKVAGHEDKPGNYLHNEASWLSFWEEVEQITGTTWEVDTCLRTWVQDGIDPQTVSYLPPQSRLLHYFMKRLT